MEHGNSQDRQPCARDRALDALDALRHYYRRRAREHPESIDWHSRPRWEQLRAAAWAGLDPRRIPAPQMAGPRPRTRRSAPVRTRGSRRTSSSSRSSGTDPGDPDGEPEPPGLGLWWHPRWGSCTPSLLRALLHADRGQVAR